MMENGQLLAKDFLVPFATAMRRIVRENNALQKATEKLTSQQNRMTTAYKKMVNEVFQNGGAEFFGGVFKDIARVITKATPYVKAFGNVLFTTLGAIWDVGAGVIDLTTSLAGLIGNLMSLGQADKAFAGLRMAFHGLASAVYTVIAGIHELSALVKGDLDLKFDTSRLTDDSFWKRGSASTTNTTNNNNITLNIDAKDGDMDKMKSTIMDLFNNELAFR